MVNMKRFAPPKCAIPVVEILAAVVMGINSSKGDTKDCVNDDSAVYKSASIEIGKLLECDDWIRKDSDVIPVTDPYWKLNGGAMSICEGLSRISHAPNNVVEVKRMLNNLPSGRGFESLVRVFIDEIKLIFKMYEDGGVAANGSIAAGNALSVVLRLAVRLLPAARMPVLRELSKEMERLFGRKSELYEDTVSLYSSLFELCITLWRIEDTKKDNNDTTSSLSSGASISTEDASSSPSTIVVYPYLNDFVAAIIDHSSPEISLENFILLLLRAMTSPMVRLQNTAMAVFNIMAHLDPKIRAIGKDIFVSRSHPEEFNILLARLSLQLIQKGRRQESLELLTLYTVLVRSPNALASLQARTDADNTLIPLAETIYQATLSPSSPSLLMSIRVIILLLMVRQVGCSLNASECMLKKRDFQGLYKRDHLEKSSSSDDDDEEEEEDAELDSARAVSVSSILVLVLVRTAHWNYSTGRDEFLTIAIAATLQNLARAGVKNLNWLVVQKLLAFTKLIAKTTPVRSEVIQTPNELLLLSLMCLITTSMAPINILSNTPLVYALLREHEAVLMNNTKGDTKGDIQSCRGCLQSMCQKLCQIIDLGGDEDWLDTANLNDIMKYITGKLASSGAADTGRDSLGFNEASAGGPCGKCFNRCFNYNDNAQTNCDELIWSVVFETSMPVRWTYWLPPVPTRPAVGVVHSRKTSIG